LFIAFLALFSLDIFGNNYTFWEAVVGLLMHNIPVFILAILLWISWKREWIGAITFILFGIWYVSMNTINALEEFQWYYLAWIVQIAGPAFLIGILFWINWKRRKK